MAETIAYIALYVAIAILAIIGLAYLFVKIVKKYSIKYDIFEEYEIHDRYLKELNEHDDSYNKLP